MSEEVFNNKDKYDQIPMSLWLHKCGLVWDKSTYEGECPRCDTKEENTRKNLIKHYVRSLVKKYYV